MFEKASRLKLRFSTSIGMLSAEDLWDLPLSSRTGTANLDDVARNLDADLKQGAGISFVTKTTAVSEILKLKFDIVLHIISIKLAEADAAAQVRANKDKKQQLLGIIAQKENETLMGTSLDELKKMVESM